MAIVWDKETEDKFRLLIAKMPVFMRPVAQKAIIEKAQKLVIKDNRDTVSEKDMVDAFFLETPFGFQGLMKNDLLSVGIDYTKYGHAK